MQKLFFGILFATVQLSAYPQEKWEITPVKGLKKGMGLLNLVFADSVIWSVDIYSGSNKFIANHSIMDRRNAADTRKYYEMTPDICHFKLNTVLVENVPIEAGKETRLRTGVLDITTAGNWELRTEAKKFLTTGNKTKKMALPIGKYQLSEGGSPRLVEVIEQETHQSVDPKTTGNYVDNQFHYVISNSADIHVGYGKLTMSIPKDTTITVFDQKITIPFDIKVNVKIVEPNNVTADDTVSITLPREIAPATYKIFLNGKRYNGCL